MASLEQEIGSLLREKGLTLSTVESATGGLISARITGVAGSSDYYKGSVVSYSNEIKMRLVGVKEETLNKRGAVSHEVAREMAAGGRKILGVDICLSDTGIAGPGGATPGKDVGLFYVGLSHKNGTLSKEYHFTGNRNQNRKQAADAALAWLKEYLISLNTV